MYMSSIIHGYAAAILSFQYQRTPIIHALGFCCHSHKSEVWQSCFLGRRTENRAFSVAGPEEWNSLPVSGRQGTSVAQFKSKLRTLYFDLECSIARSRARHVFV